MAVNGVTWTGKKPIPKFLHYYSPHFYSRIGGAVDGAIPKYNDGAIDGATKGVKQKLSLFLELLPHMKEIEHLNI